MNDSRYVSTNNNQTQNYFENWSNINWIYALLIICLSAIIIGNILVLVIFLRKPFRAKKSSYLLINLTFADLTVGVSTMAIQVLAEYFWKSNYRDEIFPYLSYSEIVPLTCVMASIFTISGIALERSLAVFRPFQHRLLKKWHFLVTIVVVWLCAFTSSLGITFGHERKLNDNYYSSIYRIIYIILASIAMGIICVCYVAIWIKMKFFTKFQNCRTIRDNNKLSKTLFIVTVLSLITWLPRMITDTVKMFDQHYVSSMIWNKIASFLLYSNSFVNIVVYSTSMPEFRGELRRICYRRNRQGVVELGEFGR